MAMQMLTYPSIIVSVSMVNNPQVVNTQWTVVIGDVRLLIVVDW
jgi:hypothetical protein